MLLSEDDIRTAAEAAAEKMWPESGYVGWTVGWTKDDAECHRLFLAECVAKLTAGVEVPEPYATLHHDDGYFTTKQREHDLRYSGPLRTEVVTLEAAIQYGASQRLAGREQAIEESHPDDIAVDKFAAAMKEKMAKQRAKGYSGWEDCSVEHLQSMLVSHIVKGDPVDVGNFAMMLWNRGDKTELEDQWVYDATGKWPTKPKTAASPQEQT